MAVDNSLTAERNIYHAGLYRWSVLLACCTLLLVVAGGLVTSRDAGLSVPDWPLSYGKLMPQMEGGILYEHGHRMVATTVGWLTGPHVAVPTTPRMFVGTPFNTKFCGGTIWTYRSGTIKDVVLTLPC